jgi:hypothetical protein
MEATVVFTVVNFLTKMMAFSQGVEEWPRESWPSPLNNLSSIYIKLPPVMPGN